MYLKTPGVIQDDKITTKNSMKNINHTTIYQLQNELGKSHLLPDSACFSQSCKEKAEQKDSFASGVYSRPSCI